MSEKETYETAINRLVDVQRSIPAITTTFTDERNARRYVRNYGDLAKLINIQGYSLTIADAKIVATALFDQIIFFEKWLKDV